MNPNQPNPQPSYNSYLDEIAPKQVKTNLLQTLKPIHIVIGVVILIIIIMLIVSIANSAANAPKRSLERLAARLQTTSEIAVGATDILKSSELRTLNSNLKIYLTNTNRDLVEPMANVGIDAKKISKSTTALEADTELIARLDDARLNAVYDRTYAREMSYKLDTILTLMSEIYGSINSRSVKATLNTSYENLKPIQQQFADFNAANS